MWVVQSGGQSHCSLQFFLTESLAMLATKNLDYFLTDHLEVQAQSLKRNIRSNLLPASSQILRSRNLNSGEV